MGGKSKNFKELLERRRRWKNIEPYQPDEKKEINQEDRSAIIALWEQSKEKNKKKDSTK